jgi:hypothetical protein
MWPSEHYRKDILKCEHVTVQKQKFLVTLYNDLIFIVGFQGRGFPDARLQYATKHIDWAWNHIESLC